MTALAPLTLRIADLRRDGMMPKAIAARLGCKAEHVCYHIAKARRAGLLERVGKRGGDRAPRTSTATDPATRQLALPCWTLEDTAYMRGEARRRGRSMDQLLRDLLDVVVRDELVGAILDDGERR